MINLIKNKLLNLINHNSSNYFLTDKSGNDYVHHLFTFDLVEYNFKDVYRSFNISYFSSDNFSNEDIVNVDELKDYEMIENITNDNLIILIKKFKLKITIKKINELSDNIIISECPNINLNFLKNADSLIKIAFVKDNLDEWLNNENFNEFDYIFTLKDYQNSFMDQKNVLVIENASKFIVIKSILNSLFKIKSNKFYSFVRNYGFNNVFPKFNNYFTILNSEFFDEEWYGENYGLSDLNMDLAIHYLLVGYKKYFNPGPEFSSIDYYEANADVENAGLNPLFHYEIYGRNEDRKITLSDDEYQKRFSAISQSQYFDLKWYEDKYDISIDNLDPVNHYLKIGYKKGYNPGPNFSTEEYYKANPDVEKVGINPLLHYELYGKKENRNIHLP